MTTSTKVLWRVQVKAKTGNWINKGLFETRDAARAQVTLLREGRMRAGEIMHETALGFGNTRVVRYEKASRC